MASTRLDGKRILLTQANDFMGPALTAVLRDGGADLIADAQPLGDDPALPASIVREAGHIDVLIVHLALPAPSKYTQGGGGEPPVHRASLRKVGCLAIKSL